MIPFVTLNLDKPRKLRFGMGASVEFERTTGIKIQELNSKMCMDVKAQLLYIMLKQDDPSLTFEKTMKLVDEHAENLEVVIDAINDALNEAYKTKNA